MTKAIERLMNVAIKQGNLKTVVRLALVANQEGGGYVYLDNAFGDVDGIMTRHQFDGYLSALKESGDYKPVDGFFGTLA